MAWSSHPLNLSTFFIIEENNRRVFPVSLLWPWQSLFPWLSDFKRGLPDLSRGANASSFLAQSFLFKYFLWFDLAGWSMEVLFCPDRTQHKLRIRGLPSESVHQLDWCSLHFLTMLCSLINPAILVQLHYLCPRAIMVFLSKENVISLLDKACFLDKMHFLKSYIVA